MPTPTIANNAVASWLSVDRPDAGTGGLPNDGGFTSLQTIIQNNGFARVKSLGIPGFKSIPKSIVLTTYALNTDPTSGTLSFTSGWSTFSSVSYSVFADNGNKVARIIISFLGQPIGQGEAQLSANASTAPLTGLYNYYITVDDQPLYFQATFSVFAENADNTSSWAEYLQSADKLQFTGAVATQELSADSFIATLKSSLVALSANTALDPTGKFLTAVASRQSDGSFTGSGAFGFSISSPTSATSS